MVRCLIEEFVTVVGKGTEGNLAVWDRSHGPQIAVCSRRVRVIKSSVE